MAKHMMCGVRTYYVVSRTLDGASVQVAVGNCPDPDAALGEANHYLRSYHPETVVVGVERCSTSPLPRAGPA